MARRRMIDPGIWQSEDFSNLSTLAKITFIGLFSMADDEGRGRAKAVYIKSMLFPYDEQLRVTDIEKSLEEIAARMSITFYCHAGSEYYQLDHWTDWQTIDRPKPSKIPPFSSISQKSRGCIAEESSIDRRRVADASRLKEKKGKEEKGREEKRTRTRHKYGQYGWVELTEEQYHKLVADIGEADTQRCIAYVDEAAQSTGNKNMWKDWNLTVRRCYRDGWGLKRGGATKCSMDFSRQSDDLALLEERMGGCDDKPTLP